MNLKKIPTGGKLDAYIVDNFLSKEHCDHLIRIIAANHTRATIIAKEKADKSSYKGEEKRINKFSIESEQRTNSSCHQLIYDPIALMYDAKLSKLMGIPQHSSDNMQGLYYNIKEKYNCHMDAHVAREIIEESGQRTWTAIVYLNQPEGGGGTKFCNLKDLVVQPRVGRLLIWNNLLANGKPNEWSKHAGMPVTAGKKYCIVKWYKEMKQNPHSVYTYNPNILYENYPVDLFKV